MSGKGTGFPARPATSGQRRGQGLEEVGPRGGCGVGGEVHAVFGGPGACGPPSLWDLRRGVGVRANVTHRRVGDPGSERAEPRGRLQQGAGTLPGASARPKLTRGSPGAGRGGERPALSARCAFRLLLRERGPQVRSAEQTPQDAAGISRAPCLFSW